MPFGYTGSSVNREISSNFFSSWCSKAVEWDNIPGSFRPLKWTPQKGPFNEALITQMSVPLSYKEFVLLTRLTSLTHIPFHFTTCTILHKFVHIWHWECHKTSSYVTHNIYDYLGWNYAESSWRWWYGKEQNDPVHTYERILYLCMMHLSGDNSVFLIPKRN